MLRRTSILLLASFVIVVLLAACGGDGNTPVQAPAETVAPLPVTATQTGVGQATVSPTQGIPAVTVETSSVSPTDTPTSGSSSSDSIRTSPGGSGLPTVEVVKKLKPSVVQIVTEVAAMGAMNQVVPSMGVGTGIVLDEEGFILTNNHVIRSAQAITVTLNDGRTFPAELIGGDAGTDTAVIRIEAEGLSPAVLGKSSELLVGQDVIAIGHALGLPGGPTVSKGVVSALGRSIAVDAQTTMVDLIQTDASINPGNSGGPLANALGEVIGMNTAVIRGSQGIGFAINIDDAQFVVEQLRARGYVDRGFLGISPINLSPQGNRVLMAI